MTSTEKMASPAHDSRRQTRQRTKRASNPEPLRFQLIVAETDGLVGRKVVYNEKYLDYFAKRGYAPAIPLPPCGYFTIRRAVLHDDGRVMVELSDHENLQSFNDGTHICAANLRPFKQA